MIRHLLVITVFAATAASAQQAALERFPVASNNAPLTWNTGPYAYDAAGNVSAIGSQYFLYDTTSRLATAHIVTLNASATQSYAYDPYGNLTSLTGYGPDELLPSSTSTNHLDTAIAEYDSAGNLKKWLAREDVVYNYGYDAAGMMTTLSTGTGPNPYTVTYVYDADDQRVMTADLSANDSHVTIRDLAGSVLTDLELKGTTWSHRRDYVYRDGAMTAATSPGGLQFFSLDHLGSPRLVTDDNGYVLAFQTFLPYGQELGQPTFTDGAVKKFTGHERDADPAGAGNPLDYMHARFYSGVAGRFLSVDPALDAAAAIRIPQLWNRYAYLAGNPVNGTDPTGRMRVQLGQHTDDQIEKRQAAIASQLQAGGLTDDQQTALKNESTALAWEKQGNQVVGKMLEALDRTDQRNGLQLSNFTLTTDSANDFPGAPAAAIANMMTKEAFVFSARRDTIYIRTEPANGSYQVSQENQDAVYYGASTLRHEQVHLQGNSSENAALTLQRSVLREYGGMYIDPILYRAHDQWLQREIAKNPH